MRKAQLMAILMVGSLICCNPVGINAASTTSGGSFKVGGETVTEQTTTDDTEEETSDLQSKVDELEAN